MDKMPSNRILHANFFEEGSVWIIKGISFGGLLLLLDKGDEKKVFCGWERVSEERPSTREWTLPSG